MIKLENQKQLVSIRKNLDRYFSQEELHTICFDLGLDYESLPCKGKSAKTRELVMFCERTNLITKLIQEVQPLRPHVNWLDF